MKNSKPMGYTVQDLADRVQYWMGRDFNMLFWSFSERTSLYHWLQLHTCDLVKLPPLPPRVVNRNPSHKPSQKRYTLNLESFSGGFQDRFNDAVSCAPTSINLKKFYRPSHWQEKQCSDFSQQYTIRWQLKERFFVSKRLQLPRRQEEARCHHNQMIAILDIPKQSQKLFG